jgi:hypothetical protein
MTLKLGGKGVLPSLLYVLILLMSSSYAYADFYLHRWDNHHEQKGFWTFNLDVIYYNSSSNFDGSGSSVSIDDLRYYSRFQDDLTLSYGISDRLSVYGRMSWAYVNQNSTTQPGTAFGFADQTLGLSFRLADHRPLNAKSAAPFSLDLQLQSDIPAYSTSSSAKNQTPFVGDGTIDFTGGLFVIYPLARNKKDEMHLIGGAGYTYRTSGFSAAIPWSLYFQYLQKNEGIFATIGSAGMASLKTDPNGSDSGTVRSSSGGGGSYFIGGTNPSLINVYGQVGYKIGPKTDISLSASQSVWGQASPNGLSVALGFQSRIGYDGRTNPVLLTPKDYGHSNQGFQNYSLEARVLKSNDRLNLVKIDKGSQDGIEVGQVFDLFITKKDNSPGEAIARATASSTKTNETALEVTEFYKEVWIEEGFWARRLVQ